MAVSGKPRSIHMHTRSRRVFLKRPAWPVAAITAASLANSCFPTKRREKRTRQTDRYSRSCKPHMTPRRIAAVGTVPRWSGTPRTREASRLGGGRDDLCEELLTACGRAARLQCRREIFQHAFFERGNNRVVHIRPAADRRRVGEFLCGQAHRVQHLL